jgi:hypothetical protein
MNAFQPKEFDPNLQRHFDKTNRERLNGPDVPELNSEIEKQLFSDLMELYKMPEISDRYSLSKIIRLSTDTSGADPKISSILKGKGFEQLQPLLKHIKWLSDQNVNKIHDVQLSDNLKKRSELLALQAKGPIHNLLILECIQASAMERGAILVERDQWEKDMGEDL